jgi:hypothetical protein
MGSKGRTMPKPRRSMKTTRKTIKRANLFDLAGAGLISVMNTISLFNNGTKNSYTR